jgi:hypothetical protein
MAYRSHPQFNMLPRKPEQSYGQCDSYFVENHEDDDGAYARVQAEKERARSIARLRQKALADDLSRATAAEYQDDVLAHMERMEVSRHDFIVLTQSDYL